MVELSIDDLRSAWEHVSGNGGCAGVDGITVERFGAHAESNLPELLRRVRSGEYQPLPLLEIVVEKKPGSGSRRRLLVPCVADRIVQTAVAHQLSRSFEEEFLEASFAYRPGRSVDRAVARILQLRDRGYTFVVDADIEGYFDSVSHPRLLRMLKQQRLSDDLMALVHGWVKPDVWDGHEVKPLRRGIPQGSPISPLFANFFLGPFDEEMEKGDNRLIRYADDLLVLCRDAEKAAAALEQVDRLLGESGLKLNREKTRVVTFAEGFQFLGVYFTGDKAYTPWKARHADGRVFSMAKPMPPRLLTKYRRDQAYAATEKAERQPAPAPDAPAPSYMPAGPKPADGRSYMAFLYVTEQGAIVRKSGDRVLVEKDEQILLDLPYHKLECVLLFGNVQVTTQAMAELLDKGVLLSLFSRQGRFRGWLSPAQGKNVDLRVAQFDAYRDEKKALEFARRTVKAKVSNGLAVIERYRSRAGETGDADGTRAALAAAATDAANAPGIAAADGIEGAAAKAYFEGVMKHLRSDFAWPGRVKHPATDPINALLSLTYTLLMHEITGLLEGVGLDAYLGFLHQPDYGRPSLSLDVMEPFRHPVADRLVLTCLNRGMFHADDFQPGGDQDGVFLIPGAMRRYFAEYERWMMWRPKTEEGASRHYSFRGALKREVEHLTRVLRSVEEWNPFDYERFGDAREEAGCSTLSVTT